jgi:hypothetical protein
MSLLDKEYEDNINDFNNNGLFLNDDYLDKSFNFKSVLDEFLLLNKITDSFFNEVYKNGFSYILYFETENNFNYSIDEINDLEENLKDIAEFNFNKYNKILDYMILKSTDVESEFYGSIIHFTFNIFDQIKRSLLLFKKVKEKWKNEYKATYKTFKDFKNSNEFENILINIATEEQLKTKEEDFHSFLIFTSINSDFLLKELYNRDANKFLFDDNKVFFKNNGISLLKDISSRIISYN